MERKGFGCGVQRQDFRHLLLALTTTSTMIPGQEPFPQSQIPHDTCWNHWNTQKALGLGAKSNCWQKAGPYQCHRNQSSDSDNGPQRTQQKSANQTHKCRQQGQLDIRTEGVGGRPGSRRPCSLVLGLPPQGPHWSHEFWESQWRREAMNRMCQWFKLNGQAVSWLFWVSFFQLENDLTGGKTVRLR